MHPAFTAAVNNLDPDVSQYVHDNTEDEFSHFMFLNGYLQSKGAEPVDLTPFQNLIGSTAQGSSGKKRITNLMQLTIDTSWWDALPQPHRQPRSWTRVRSHHSRLAPGQVPGHSAHECRPLAAEPPSGDRQHRGIPLRHYRAGGSSLYPQLAQRASSLEVLRILLSIGPTETMHFQTWSDKAGNFLPVKRWTATYLRSLAIAQPAPRTISMSCGEADPNTAGSRSPKGVLPICSLLVQ